MHGSLTTSCAERSLLQSALELADRRPPFNLPSKVRVFSRYTTYHRLFGLGLLAETIPANCFTVATRES